MWDPAQFESSRLTSEKWLCSSGAAGGALALIGTAGVVPAGQGAGQNLGVLYAKGAIHIDIYVYISYIQLYYVYI